MAYIGTSPTQGVRRIYNYTATASQTSFSGNDTLGISLAYADGAYIDVYQNGVLLIPTDYVATTGTTVVLDTGAAVNDTVQMVVYDVFSVGDSVSQSAGGNFAGNVGMGGTLAVTGIATFTDDIIIGDGKTIGSASDVDAMTIASNGVVSASAGIALGVGTANTASNVLDDYEEGTWTPGLGNYAGSPTVAAANYTKIGRQVIAFCSITLDGTTDGSGFQITGLPFTSGNFASTSVMGGFLNWSTTGLTTPIRILVLNSDTKCQVYGPTGSAVTYENVGNDKGFRFTIIYCTA